jgi:YD repeat-containing protein
MPDDGQRPDQPFLYDAFISYRHLERDRKWAEWLIDALERFRVPQSLQDRGLPPRLRKIFRDEDEVPASADLNDQIKQALLASRYLIVVCSAFTPRSKWVQREIEIFNELGRGDNVLALLTEGEPGDSFPTPMLERHREVRDAAGGTRIVKEDKEPLAADVRPRKGVSERTLKRLALLRLVAVILGVKFDDLRQRDHERERRARTTSAALAAALCLCMMGGAAAYWQMMQPKVAHYRQVVSRWGLPEGLGMIDAETRDHLSTHYTVTTQRSSLFEPLKVVEARQENSAGTLRADEDGEARWVVHYGPGKLSATIEIFDANNRPTLESHLERAAAANILIITFKRDTVDFAQHVRVVVDPNQQPLDAKSDITRKEFTLDDRGFVIRSRYQNHYGVQQHDATGSYGRNIIVSSDGLAMRTAEVGADGNEITLRTGVRATVLAYDSNFNLIRRTLIGQDDKPSEGPDGFACELLERDRWGNLTKRTYCNADDSPVRSRFGMAKIVTAYDERGNDVENAYLDADDKPTLNGWIYASLRRTYDERGNKTEESYFGTDGQPTLSKEGFAKIRYRYNGSGREIERAFFDIDEKPVPGTFGYARFTQKYDDRDNLVETAYFGRDGKPTLNRERYAKVTYTFNARNQQVRGAYFDGDGRPTLSADGYAGFTTSYDSRGNFSKVEFFDVDNRPTLNRRFGFAGCEFWHDEGGAITRMDCFGTDGKPVIGDGGFASVHLSYDDHGNATEVALFGPDEKPVLGKLRYAANRRKFDPRGNLIGVEFLGLDGKPILSAEGITRVAYAYDTRNREVGRAFFGLDGERVLLADTGQGGIFGHAGFHKKYDDRGNMIEVAYFGTEGKPRLTNEKIAKIKYEFNARSQEVGRAFFGVDDKPTPSTNGYAAFRQQFDVRGNIVEQTYFGADGEPVAVGLGYAKVIYNHDYLGRETDAKYFDALNRPLSMDVLIVSVIPGTIGERIGLAAGDRIESYDGHQPTSTKQFIDAVIDASGHQTRVLIVRRGTQELTYEVPPGRVGIVIKMVAEGQGGAAELHMPGPDQSRTHSP